MTLPASGAISIYQVAVELGISATGLNLNDSRVRDLARVYSGAISMSSLHGKTRYTYSVSLVLGYYYPQYPETGLGNIRANIATSDDSYPVSIASMTSTTGRLTASTSGTNKWIYINQVYEYSSKYTNVYFTAVVNMSNGRQATVTGGPHTWYQYHQDG